MKKLFSVFLALTLLLSASAVVLADDTTNSGDSGKTRATVNVRQEVKQEVKSDLQNVRQQTCETRMETIRTRSNSLSDRAQKMEEGFGSIASRVEEFYTSKLVPAGATVSNYDSLVAAISTKKDAVDSALADAKSKTQDFDCGDVTTAKTRVNEYRTAMQKVIAALKEYRTAVKNLIVAVRTAAGTVKPSPSPSPES